MPEKHLQQSQKKRERKTKQEKSRKKTPKLLGIAKWSSRKGLVRSKRDCLGPGNRTNTRRPKKKNYEREKKGPRCTVSFARYERRD